MARGNAIEDAKFWQVYFECKANATVEKRDFVPNDVVKALNDKMKAASVVARVERARKLNSAIPDFDKKSVTTKKFGPADFDALVARMNERIKAACEETPEETAELDADLQISE
jgi:hypothetical protein